MNSKWNDAPFKNTIRSSLGDESSNSIDQLPIYDEILIRSTRPLSLCHNQSEIPVLDNERKSTSDSTLDNGHSSSLPLQQLPTEIKQLRVDFMKELRSETNYKNDLANVYSESKDSESPSDGALQRLTDDFKAQIKIKPPLHDINYISHSGQLLRLKQPWKNPTPCTAKLNQNILHTFKDTDELIQKELIQMSSVFSIQRLMPHKINSSTNVFCFAINWKSSSTPKTTKSSSNSSFIYGSTVLAESKVWMQNLLSSMTSVFPLLHTQSYSRAGWCYTKMSLVAEWQPSWILLTRKRSFLWSSGGRTIETVDLRKAKFVDVTAIDQSLQGLNVDAGPVILIETSGCTLYLIMATAYETEEWKDVIYSAAVKNGVFLKDQQLTKDNVPVVVDMCVNVIYAYGSRMEGIYRKTGSKALVEKLLDNFRKDACAVQNLSAINVHVIASCLKKFMRDLPEPLIGVLAMSFIGVSKMINKIEKIECYKELLSRLPEIEYQTLRKITGHLNFIQSQQHHNRMSSGNLAMLWGVNLLKDPQVEMNEYSEEEKNVMHDLIVLYKDVFNPKAEELENEQKLLAMLELHYAVANKEPVNVADKINNIKVWIKYFSQPGASEEETSLHHITLSTAATVYDVCKEVAAGTPFGAHELTLSECILNSNLKRPMHHAEIVMETVLRWSNWSDEDRRHNHLEVKPAGLLTEIANCIKTLPTLTQNLKLQFADIHSKSLGLYTIVLMDNKIRILKKERNEYEKHHEFSIENMFTYLGSEKLRGIETGWSITFIEKNFKNRSRDKPFIGHLLTGENSEDQLMWYSTILYSLHQTDLIPMQDIR